MSTGAWIMLIFGAGTLYGSLAYFIWVALRHDRNRARLQNIGARKTQAKDTDGGKEVSH